MSFLGSFNPFNIVKAIVKNPLKVIPTAIVTGGVSLVSPKVSKIVSPVVSQLYNPKLIPAAVGLATGNPALALGGVNPLGTGGGVPKMSLDIGGILGQVGNIFGGNQNPIFQGISNVATLANNFVPSTTRGISPTPVSQTIQPTMVANIPMRRSSNLTQEIVTAGGNLLARLGMTGALTRSSFPTILKRALGSIASLARRTPTGTIVSVLAGLGLSLYEANLLTAWHAQRRAGRRMNPANSKALRRAARRIRSFHKLCTHVDLIRTHRRSTGRAARCGTCRKSPCRC